MQCLVVLPWRLEWLVKVLVGIVQQDVRHVEDEHHDSILNNE